MDAHLIGMVFGRVVAANLLVLLLFLLLSRLQWRRAFRATYGLYGLTSTFFIFLIAMAFASQKGEIL